MNALELFRMGKDYIQIAAFLGKTEAQVEIMIHSLREDERFRTYMREYRRRERAQDRNARAER